MRRMILVVVSILAASLLVVTPALAAPASLPASAPPAAPPAWGTARYHVVRAGETLFSIGRRYGVNPWAIASANGCPGLSKCVCPTICSRHEGRMRSARGLFGSPA